MVGVGIIGLIFLVIQILVARFVYREARTHNRRSSLVLSSVVFISSIACVVIMESLLLVLLIQAIAIVMYLIVNSKGHSLNPQD